MRYWSLASLLFILSCSHQTPQVYKPVGGVLSQEDLQVSKNRAKDLNLAEIRQIQEWISQQDIKYYPTGLNYWSNIPELDKRIKKTDGQMVSYQYELYDFDNTKLYDQSVEKKEVILGKFSDLRAVENAVRYLNPNEEVTLLVPSVLAFGTYGDNNKIPNDLPLIIKIKML